MRRSPCPQTTNSPAVFARRRWRDAPGERSRRPRRGARNPGLRRAAGCRRLTPSTTGAFRPAPCSAAATASSAVSAAAAWARSIAPTTSSWRSRSRSSSCPPEVDHDPARLMQLHSEVRMARQVSHPNVCRVYDIDEVDGHTFLSMEYVDGEELGSLLRRIGRFPVERALEMARQICAGPGRGARARRHPSRSQAGQRDARRRRQGAHHRFRAGRRDRRDGSRGNAGLHGARTARRQRGDGAERHLRARPGALRAVHGTARHRGEERRGSGAQARGRDRSRRRRSCASWTRPSIARSSAASNAIPPIARRRRWAWPRRCRAAIRWRRRLPPAKRRRRRWWRRRDRRAR